MASKEMTAKRTNNNKKHTSQSKKVLKNAGDVAKTMMLKSVGLKMQYVINVMKRVT